MAMRRNHLLRFLGDLHRWVGFYAKDLASGKRLEHQADTRFPAVGFLKLNLLIELFRQAEVGKLQMSERRPLASGTSGVGPLQSLQNRPMLTLRDYGRLMILFDDSTAARLLMDILYPTSSSERLRVLGVPFTYLAHDATPRELGTLFEKLALGELISSQASSEILELLKQANMRQPNLFVGYLPEDAVVVNKCGADTAVQANAAIVFQPRGAVVISAFAQGQTLGGPPPELILELAKQILVRIARS
jgi:beta-lactamase class A